VTPTPFSWRTSSKGLITKQHKYYKDEERRGSSSVPSPRLPAEPRPDLSTPFVELMYSYWRMKQSTNLQDKTDWVTKEVPKFFKHFTDAHPANMGMIADILVAISYSTQRTGTSLTLKVPIDGKAFFRARAGEDDVVFTLVDQFTQRLEPEDLEALPWTVEPGTAVHIWEAKCRGRTWTIPASSSR